MAADLCLAGSGHHVEDSFHRKLLQPPIQFTFEQLPPPSNPFDYLIEYQQAALSAFSKLLPVMGVDSQADAGVPELLMIQRSAEREKVDYPTLALFLKIKQFKPGDDLAAFIKQSANFWGKFE